MNRKILKMLFIGILFLSPLYSQPQEKSNQSDKREIQSTISGCPVLPANNVWNTPIDHLPVDSNSAQYINTIGANKNLHADFGSGLWAGGPIGIPFITVPGTQETVDVSFLYDDESDPGPYPIPSDAPIEGGSSSDGDRHVLVLDRDNCILYELYYAFPQPDGSWTAGSGAIFHLNSNALRPAGWTSADAAGLPILPGLVRYQEVAAGEIKHAIRFTAPQTQRKYIWPARHYASSLTGSQYPPMGQRFRLKANFDISGFSTHAQVILKALKKYGMILADNGSSWFISGVPDERWNNSILHELHSVQGSDFEAIDESSIMIHPNSGEAKQNVTPATISITSPNGGENWTVGTPHNITWTTTGTIGNLRIQYSINNGNQWNLITSSTPNDGSYNWVIPSTPSSNCQVRISDIDGSPSDESDAVFTISSELTPEITVISPNGGENWPKQSIKEISWTSIGNISNVSIELIKSGNSILTISSSITNTGTLEWTVPSTLNADNDYQIKISDASDKSINDTGGLFTISDSLKPEISLNRTKLNAGAIISGDSTSGQTFWINNTGTGTLNWTVTTDAQWIITTPTSGTNSGKVKVSISANGLSTGTYSGLIYVSDANADNSPQTVTVSLIVKNSSQDQFPFGSFDSPTNNATVMGSIPVTGWALDDIDIENVKIYRKGQQEDVLIGNAIFVEGARPDVEATYPNFPKNYTAGWGYMLLTNFLPNNGNGTFQLYAIARDTAGHEVLLGNKTITCDNNHAINPFGAIDTPNQGGEASGQNFINWGWVLTPLPNSIPENGSTIRVFVDSVFIGNPTYNIYRADIASLFPGYYNSDGAIGKFSLNTTAYSNGIHTIHWTATDNAGNTDGIGSRYFTINNPGNSLKESKNNIHNLSLGSLNIQKFSPRQIDDLNKSKSIPPIVLKGYDKEKEVDIPLLNMDGNWNLQIKEMELIEIHLNGNFITQWTQNDLENPDNVHPSEWQGIQMIERRVTNLPIGSTLDKHKGIFYWQSGPGFLGEYHLIFYKSTPKGVILSQSIIITVNSKF